MDKNEIIYLAAPYTHADSSVCEERFEKITEYAASLIRKQMIVLSPVTMCHPMTKYGLLGDWQFWERFDRAYLMLCSRMIVLCLPGWKESKGVQAEIQIMKELGKPVEYVEIGD